MSLQSMPKIAIAPLLLMWIGFGAGSKIVIVFLVCFFPIVIAAVTGLNAPPAPLIDIARSFSTPAWRVYLKIRIPYSLPFVFIGLKVAITLAVTGAVVGEFVAAKEGLGYLILNGVQQFNTPLAFVAIVILGILTVVFYGLVAVAERLIVRWDTSERN
jgi:NitT/TauT family transport system permease protein